MRIGFIQLPVPGHDGFHTGANRPLAAAYMIAFARRHCRRRDWEAEILPDGLANHGGDTAVIERALQGGFDAIFFTLYLWNRGRSLYLAREIKRRRPDILTAAGGPEVTADQAPADFPGVDILCIGEGEEFFARFLDDPLLRKTGRMHPSADIADLARIPDPYLAGILPVRHGDIIHFEQMRGCPYRCAYCYYGKGSRSVRRFPADRVPGIFHLASSRDRTEVYFMDPTFNIREGLTGHLAWIAESNPERVPVHTEVRLEVIDRTIADGMAAAGIRSVEAGLQSANIKALAAVGRAWNREEFLRGARLLAERDIQIRAGIMIGLPGDGLEDFIATLDFLESARLASTAECYILAVLPGTVLRGRFNQGRMRAMTGPPYWALSTEQMAPDDFAAAIQILERRLGIDYFSPIPPLVAPDSHGFRTILDLRKMDLDADPAGIIRPAELAGSIAVFVDARTADHARLPAWADYLMSVTSHTCWRIFYPGNDEWPAESWQRLRRLFLFEDHYVNRSRSLHRDSQEAFSVRLFQVIDDVPSARRFLGAAPEADLVIRPGPGQAVMWEEICRETPWIFVDPRMPEAERSLLAAWYADRPERMFGLPPAL